MKSHYYLLLMLLAVSGCESCLQEMQGYMEEYAMESILYQQRIARAEGAALPITNRAEAAKLRTDSLNYVCRRDSTAGFGTLKVYRDSIGTVVDLKEGKGKTLVWYQLVLRNDTVLVVSKTEFVADRTISRGETPLPGYRPQVTDRIVRENGRAIAHYRSEVNPKGRDDEMGIVIEFQTITDSLDFPLRGRLHNLLQGQLPCPPVN